MADTKTDIVAAVTLTPKIVFTDPDSASALLAHMRSEIAAFVPDLATAKGRGEIAAFAFKITKTKTAIDKAGAELVEDARATVKKTDAERKKFRDDLDEMRDKVRKPLTAWEKAEEEREARSRETIRVVGEAGRITMEDTPATLRARFMEMRSFVLDEADLKEFLPMARSTLNATVVSLENGYSAAVKAENDRLELERLRKEQTARERLDQLLEYIAGIRGGTIGGRPQAYAILLNELETKIEIGGLTPEGEERVKNATAEAYGYLAGELHKQEEENAARAEREAEERAKDKAKADADEKAAKKIKAAQAETQRLKDAETERLAEETRKAKDQADREADAAHRKDVQDSAAADLVAAGLSGLAAAKCIHAIAAGLVPGVTINY